MEYRNLFSPLPLGKLTLKNRIVMTAIHLFYADEGKVNDRILEFYKRRAKGGVAMAIVGGVASDNYIGYGDMLRLDDDRYIDGFRALAEGMHQYGSLLCIQLLQTGRYGSAFFVEGDESTISASAVPSKISFDVPREMTVEEIKTVHRRAGEAAARAKKAGADCVELTAGSGYMLSQFLSPVTNKRTDEYGGSWENRCRFPLEMLAEVRRAVGPDFPILVRVAGNEFMEGGNGWEECVDLCRRLEAAGADMLDVTGGWHETVVPQLPGDLPRGGFTYLSKKVKDAVSIPVLSANRHNDPAECELTLALGRADLIGQMRAQIADPDWVIKAQSGQEALIRKCVACNQGCFANVFSGSPCECALNPIAGLEYKTREPAPAEKPKRLLVVGGGPSGCEFALQAALRGHDVTLWERGKALGGKLSIVSVPPAKAEFGSLPAYYEAVLSHEGVKVRLGMEATLENIKAGGFDEVIVATGAVPRKIELPGKSSPPVFTADQVLEKEVVCGRDVVVIGGGSVGCETADYLAQEGSISPEKLYFMMSHHSENNETIEGLLNSTDRRISVVDVAKVGANFDFGCGWPVIKDLRRLGVKLYSRAKTLEVTGGSVTIEYTDRKTSELTRLEIPCDTIVMAVGYNSENSLYRQLEAAGIKARLIGDSAAPGKIMTAIRQANELAEKISMEA